MKIIIILLVIAGTGWSATYNVKTTGSNANSCAAAQNPATPKLTIAAATACMATPAGGDTVVVFAGSYAESPTVPAGGVNSYNIITPNGTDAVTVVGGFTLNSHTKVLGNCPVPSTSGSCGFSLGNPSTPTVTCVSVATNATDIVFSGNNEYACHFWEENTSGAAPNTQNNTFMYILNNTMSFSCFTPTIAGNCRAMSIQGDHHFLEGNDISHVADGPYFSGNFVVLRNNHFHDFLTNECAGFNGDNCHIDMMQADATIRTSGATNLPTHYYLVEGNTLLRCLLNGGIGGAGCHGLGVIQGQSCAGNCSNMIVRYHLSAHVQGGTILNDLGAACPAPQGSLLCNWYNVKAYNNTWADLNQSDYTSGSAGGSAHQSGAFGAAELNQVYYYPQIGTAVNLNPYLFLANSVQCSTTDAPNGCGTAPTPPTGFPGPGPEQWGHNILFCGGSCTAFGFIYQTTPWMNALSHNNLLGDPKFTNYTGDVYTLQDISPALRAGTNLTTTTNAGTVNTNVVSVVDPGFFQDGWGFPTGSGIGQLSPDWIRLGGANAPVVQIASNGIDYVNKNITLNCSLGVDCPTYPNGTSVYLYKKSDGVQVLTTSSINPDLGAFPTVSTSITPNSLGPWTIGQTINQVFTCVGCGTSTWSSSGIFPTGLTFNSGPATLTGTIGGSAGQFTPSVSFSTFTNNYTITVNPAPSISTTSPLPNVTQGQVYSQTLTVAGGTGTPTCAITAGSLTGSSLVLGSNCIVSGTAGTPGVYAFTVTPTDTNNVSGTPKVFQVSILSSGVVGGSVRGGQVIMGGQVKQ